MSMRKTRKKVSRAKMIPMKKKRPLAKAKAKSRSRTKLRTRRRTRLKKHLRLLSNRSVPIEEKPLKRRWKSSDKSRSGGK